ncbi:MAG: MurT ligase domain-containing protein [Syntrophomonadaceae bacterium]|jgi:UDP-N-acetylmuramyl tripeptide synthase
MNKIRLILAIVVGKIIICLSRLLGNQGTDFPGKVARRICPGILSMLGKNVKKEIIIVTGTNGKTTTANMIAAIVRNKGCQAVHNQAGANMISGITTAFIDSSNFLGNRPFDYAVLETDEANVPLVAREIMPDLLLITNFFRDQLDRFGEIDTTIRVIKEAVKDTNIQLVLNGDDPLAMHFRDQDGWRCSYYGFAQTYYDTFQSVESREGRYCVFCNSELKYERYHYAQLGKYRCPSCNSQNPEPNFIGHDLEMTSAIKMKINGMEVNSPYQGFYNAYNILAAVSVARSVNIEDEYIQQAIALYRPQAGRLERFTINDRPITLILVKNPTGLNQALSAMVNDRRVKNVFFALNDNAADGRDISWIWDADVEMVSRNHAGINYVICSGQRSGDAALRFKYCGLDANRIILNNKLEEGIAETIYRESEVAYILCTYTALFKIRKILVKMEEKGITSWPGKREVPASIPHDTVQVKAWERSN